MIEPSGTYINNIPIQIDKLYNLVSDDLSNEFKELYNRPSCCIQPIKLMIGCSELIKDLPYTTIYETKRFNNKKEFNSLHKCYDFIWDVELDIEENKSQRPTSLYDIFIERQPLVRTALIFHNVTDWIDHAIINSGICKCGISNPTDLRYKMTYPVDDKFLYIDETMLKKIDRLSNDQHTIYNIPKIFRTK